MKQISTIPPAYKGKDPEVAEWSRQLSQFINQQILQLTGQSSGLQDQVTGMQSSLLNAVYDATYRSTLNATVAAVGSQPCEIWVTNRQPLTADLTIPATIALRVFEAGRIVSNSHSLRINGSFTSASQKQVFEGFNPTGNNVVFGKLSSVEPEMWGLNGVSDQASINCAVQSVLANRGAVWLAAKHYIINNQILLYTGVNIYGTSIDISSGTLSTCIDSMYDGYAFAVASSSVESYSVALKNFKVVLSSTGRTMMGGLDLSYISDGVCENIDVSLQGGNSSNAGFYIQRNANKGGYYNRITHCKVEAGSGYTIDKGVKFGGGCNQNIVQDFQGGRCVTTLFITGSHNTCSDINSEIASSCHCYIENGTGYGAHTIGPIYMDNDVLSSTGIFNNGAAGSVIINPYFSNILYPFVGCGKCAIYSSNSSRGATDAAYSPSVTVDALSGGVYRFNVTDTNAFTINAPTKPYDGFELVFLILNNSGGTMGVVTWR